MTITRADVADLQPGDVVEITSGHWPNGTSIRGPLRIDRDGWLICADFPVRLDDGEPGGADRDELRLVSQGARLYVNHQRPEPVPGDVVRDADSEFPDDQRTWMVDASHGDWFCGFMGEHYRASQLPTRLRLLVDGETGDTVPAVQS